MTCDSVIFAFDAAAVMRIISSISLLHHMRLCITSTIRCICCGIRFTSISNLVVMYFDGCSPIRVSRLIRMLTQYAASNIMIVESEAGNHEDAE